MHIKNSIQSFNTHTHTNTPMAASETNLSFKISCMPDLPSEFTKSMNKLRFAVLIVFRDKKKNSSTG